MLNLGLAFLCLKGGESVAIWDVFKKDKTEENKQIDVDPKDGQPVYREKVISFISEEYERRKREKQTLELQWQLNSNFIAGNQYCDINVNTMTVEEQPAARQDLQREVFNRMAPIYETRLAKLSKIKPAMVVRPSTNELDDIAKADVSTSLLRGTQINTGFSNTLSTAESWMETTGTVFFLSWWDSMKGKLIYEEEIEIFDDKTQERKRDIKRLFEGDLSYGLITPYEVYPDSIFVQETEDCESIIIRQVKSVDEIYNVYGVRLEGRPLPTFCMTPQAAAGGLGYEATVNFLTTSTRDNAEAVTTYFRRPGRDYPNGQMIIVLGETELAYYGSLPYKVGEHNAPAFPIVKCCSIKRAGQFFCGTV